MPDVEPVTRAVFPFSMMTLKLRKRHAEPHAYQRLCGVTFGRNRANVGRFLLRRNIKIQSFSCFAMASNHYLERSPSPLKWNDLKGTKRISGARSRSRQLHELGACPRRKAVCGARSTADPNAPQSARSFAGEP